MEWNDDAIVLSARPFGETAAIVTLLTLTLGRHAGLLPGGQGSRNRPRLEPGNLVQAKWRARMTDQLGTLTMDIIVPHAARWMDEPKILALITSAAAIVEASLPERQPMPGVYAGLLALLEIEDAELWPPTYIKWELGVLQALGYGLDLTSCAGGGDADDLTFVSPRTGRAVSRALGQPYEDKLLPLPGFLLGRGGWNDDDIADGLALTAHFFSRHIFSHPQNRMLIPVDGMLPLARQRLMDFYNKDQDLLEESENLASFQNRLRP